MRTVIDMRTGALEEMEPARRRKAPAVREPEEAPGRHLPVEATGLRLLTVAEAVAEERRRGS